MKITGKDLLQLVDDNDLDTLTRLRDHVNEALKTAVNHRYIKVRIMNREGNSPEMHQKIKETLPQIQYRWQGEPGTIGEFELFIPRKMWNDEIKVKCESLDSFVGTHQETSLRYRLKEDTPQELKELYSRADNQRLRDIKTKATFDPWDSKVKEYIETYTVVLRTWTDHLDVDLLTDHDYEWFKEHSNWEITF